MTDEADEELPDIVEIALAMTKEGRDRAPANNVNGSLPSPCP